MYRRSSIKSELDKLIIKNVIETIEKTDIILFLMDIQEKVSKQDKKILLTCMNRHKQIILVFTKADLLKKSSFKSYLKDFYYHFPIVSYMKALKISAMKNIGISELLNQIKQLYQNMVKVLPSEKLEGFIRDVHKEYFINRKNYFEILYVKQIQQMRFMLKVKNKDKIKPDYPKFLIKKIRNEFSLNGISINIVFKEKNYK